MAMYITVNNALCMCLCVLQSGTSPKEDLDSISHLPSVPREGSVPASLDASCTTQVHLQSVMQILKSMDGEINEIRKDMLEVKETLKQLASGHPVEVQMRMEQQQLPEAVSNCNGEEQLAPAQRPRVSEFDSCESVSHTCPNSGENGKGNQDMGGSVGIRVGYPTQPPTTLNLQTDLKQQPTSPITRHSKLDNVPEESMDFELSLQVSLM